MASHALDPSSLVTFGSAAAGHDGVLSDSSGTLVIKPCTPAEIAFYESANTSHPDLAAYMPLYMGTLQLSAPDAAAASTASTGDEVGTAASLALSDPGPLKGKKLDTGVSIVLENVAAGFRKPNIMDIKLGARLYDDSTKPEKRARLDKVAAETTSSSLGFRIAGMRTWLGGEDSMAERDGDDTISFEAGSGYKLFNKLYGRKFAAENVVDAFREYVLVPSAGVSKVQAANCVQRFIRDLKDLQQIFEKIESRMYSASILLVYEGDPDAYAAATKAETEYSAQEEMQEDDEEEEEEAPPKIAVVKLIDFAHASWTPGQGPDENLLQGVRSTIRIMEELAAELGTS
ncbi:hypothetical protein W97_00287 [Coniosporium apollinis CBS 100218]|uniref:Kinase n=1 Tax=Coniosporium apollinis (strain CBS 100218) TaxID=1168221 RepID=R7YHH3_CONA1|nr:uncharacterized protein W97_00287 [Coniosporium apollinis CBS 100218]EON61076.1 hypothetical protein W97_00287 [Coniosporium apollinis CBS 100218]